MDFILHKKTPGLPQHLRLSVLLIHLFCTLLLPLNLSLTCLNREINAQPSAVPLWLFTHIKGKKSSVQVVTWALFNIPALGMFFVFIYFEL